MYRADYPLSFSTTRPSPAMRSRNAITAVANLLLLLPAVPVRAATCYNVDNTKSTDKAMAPCHPDADFSPCCAINKGARSDICMESGLCYAQDGNYRGFIYMNGCTDSTGLSSDCPHICPDGALFLFCGRDLHASAP